jgi:oligosaccharide repeat unit polymerase
MTRSITSRFLLTWLIYWILFLIQPVQSIYCEILNAWLLQASFVVAFIMNFKIAKKTIFTKHNNKTYKINLSHSRNIILIGYILSIIGLTSNFYDKFCIQQIDYSMGIASAREQWRILGEERSGEASSIFSAIGYLFGSSYFISLSLLFSRNINFSDKYRFFGLLAGGTLLLANSLTTGGRSGILLAISMISYSYFTNAPQNKYIFKNKKYKSGIYFILTSLIFYIFYVFISRASSNEIDVKDYSINFLDDLGLSPYTWFSIFVNNYDQLGITPLLNLIISYLTHSISTTAAILDHENRSEIIIFNYFFSLLSKIGVLSETNNDWFLAGRFPSLPGALYFQFGLLGMLIFSIAFGWLCGIIKGLHENTPNSMSILFTCCLIESTLLLSPFLFAGDLIFFPFTITGGAITLAISNIIKKSHL